MISKIILIAIMFLILSGCQSVPTSSTGCRKVNGKYIGDECFGTLDSRRYREKF